MSLHAKCCVEFKMFWYSAEKQSFVFSEFFNSIGQELPLQSG